ncbi:MAG: peptide chain release factor N(5)-glutamine methyltransferase [Myxococcota bacterium]
MEAWTVRRMLAWMEQDFAAKGLDSPRLDAEVLLALALQVERIRLYLDLDRPLNETERNAVRGFVQRRRGREPVAYIRGWREFWGRRFRVTPDVLIPRPDTETLVEAALARIPEDGVGPVMDLCTGSGCVVVALAAERPQLEVVASDISASALAIATENAASNEVQVRFVEGDLFASEPGPFALITANPPYIGEGELADLDADVAEHEPHLALVGGASGLELVTRLIPEAHARLQPGGWLLMEIGIDQANAVSALFEDAGFVEVSTVRDLGNIERVVLGRRKGDAETLPNAP